MSQARNLQLRFAMNLWRLSATEMAFVALCTLPVALTVLLFAFA
jgi:hypothetical protein